MAMQRQPVIITRRGSVNSFAFISRETLALPVLILSRIYLRSPGLLTVWSSRGIIIFFISCFHQPSRTYKVGSFFGTCFEYLWITLPEKYNILSKLVFLWRIWNLQEICYTLIESIFELKDSKIDLKVDYNIRKISYFQITIFISILGLNFDGKVV